MTLSVRRRPTIPVISIVLLAALGWIVGLLPGLPGPSPLNPAAMGELVALTIVAGTLGGTAAAVRRDRPAAAIAAASGGVTLIALATIHVLGERAVHPELVARGLQLLVVILGVVSMALGLVAALGPPGCGPSRSHRWSAPRTAGSAKPCRRRCRHGGRG